MRGITPENFQSETEPFQENIESFQEFIETFQEFVEKKYTPLPKFREFAQKWVILTHFWYKQYLQCLYLEILPYIRGAVCGYRTRRNAQNTEGFIGVLKISISVSN